MTDLSPRAITLEQLDLSVRTHNVLHLLGASRLADIPALSAADILLAPGSNREVLNEVEQVLDEFDLALAARDTRPVRPPEPDGPWGCLHIPAHDPGRVRGTVTQAYAQAGLQRAEDRHLEIEPLVSNDAARLGPDELLVLPESGGWVAVMSHRWEWATPAQHPLALALSASFPVLALANRPGLLQEVSLYWPGMPVAASLTGWPTPPGVVALKPEDLATWGSALVPSRLREFLDQPARLGSLLGCDRKGFRDALEAAPLDDYEPRSYLVFR